MEKGAYLGAIASIATADREASEEEMEYLEALSESAELSPEQSDLVRRAATEMTGEDLDKCLDVLKGSELRFSLVTDLIAFAEADKDYTEAEKANIERIAQHLNINKQQFSLLDQFVKKSASTPVNEEAPAQQNFLNGSGMDEKLKSAGINGGSLMKGLLGIAGPMLLAGLVTRGLSGRRRGMGGGMLGGGMMGGGGGLGGMLGGGGMMGGGGLGGMMGGGGIGSLIGMLSGGRGMRSTGGLFGRRGLF